MCVRRRTGTAQARGAKTREVVPDGRECGYDRAIGGDKRSAVSDQLDEMEAELNEVVTQAEGPARPSVSEPL